MTNSLNTPIEALERYYPLRVREYRIRKGSGGRGLSRGGEGIVRTLEMLTDCHLTILSERRKHAPYGLGGGIGGKKGMNFLYPKEGRSRRLRGKISTPLSRGDIVTIETPGGGGWRKR
jgi:N-methylhydantoinase B